MSKAPRLAIFALLTLASPLLRAQTPVLVAANAMADAVSVEGGRNALAGRKIETSQPIGIRDLIERMKANQRRVEEMRAKYVCVEVDDVDDVDKIDGISKHFVEEYEVAWPDGLPIRHLVMRDGRPLTRKERQHEDERLDQQFALHKRLLDSANYSGETISIDNLLRSASFQNERRTTYKGRPVVALDVVGNPGLLPHRHSDGGYLVNGTVWIDEQDAQIARIDALLDSDFLEAASGLALPISHRFRIRLEQERVNGQLWMPSFAEITPPGMGDRIAGVHRRVDQYYSDYRIEVSRKRQAPYKPRPITRKDLQRAY
jgi:hypothetical protein